MASFSVSCPKNSALFNGSQPGQTQNNLQPLCSVSFLSNSPALLAGSSLRLTGSKHSQSGVCKVSQLNEVAVKKSSNSVAVPETKVDEPEEKSAAETTVPDASAISAFMTQAADLIKLVDSRDIMELHLKQLDCELIIRKKEALQQQEVAAPVYMMQPPPQSQFPQQAALPAAAAPSPPPASAPAPTSPPKPKSSHPPLKCPMAGTFYRSPAPGAPAFVKVGDKIQKGQVVCIIEAMKLMNEIEADQSGTLTEILVDDGKPVSLDTPLFIIEP